MLSAKVNKRIKQIIRQALKEDIDRGDITSNLSLPSKIQTKAAIIAKEKGVLCGIKIAKEAFKQLDKSIVFSSLKADGSSFGKGEKIALIKGKAASILTAERTALNLLSLLCGIATLTKKFVEEVKGSKARILDTRKTTPLLRVLEKYAVRTGGGYNHRNSLSEAIMIKDNHLRAAGCIHEGKLDGGRIERVILNLRKKTGKKIEVEVEDLAQLKETAKYKPDIIMLDNFSLEDIKTAVSMRAAFFPKIKLEASGGVKLESVKKIAYTGVDFISVGKLTHSPKAIDFSLEIIEADQRGITR